jgi:hypothetical protein
MSNEFQRFSPAARLYAEHSAIVDKMKDIFQEEISAFLSAVRKRVESQLGNETLEEEGKNAYRSWYIAHGDYYVPYLYFNASDARIVESEVLSLEVRADGSDLSPYREQLATSLFAILLLNTSTKERGRGCCLFTLTISFKGVDDPVAVVADPILALLTAMDEAQAKLRRNSKSNESEASRQIT